MQLGRRERKRLAVHQQLLECAEKLFLDRGVSGTTVEDIAEAADVARQTVFNHFPYKEALALEISANGVQKVSHQAHALLESGSSALQVLRRVSQWLLEEAIQQGEIATVAAQELLHTDPERALRAEDQIPLIHLIEALLLQACEERTMRNDLPVKTMAEVLSRVLVTTIARIAITSRDEIRHELDICFEIVFNGITERSI